MRAGRLSLREFFAPWPLGAVGLMVLNDRVLKPRFHNAITGKLSDLAVCFFLPLFTSALLGLSWKGRPRARVVVGAIVTGLVYSGLELWPAFEHAFLAGLSVVGAPLGLRRFALTSDLTDLWALLMLPVAVAYGFRRVGATPPPATSVPGLRRDD